MSGSCLGVQSSYPSLEFGPDFGFSCNVSTSQGSLKRKSFVNMMMMEKVHDSRPKNPHKKANEHLVNEKFVQVFMNDQSNYLHSWFKTKWFFIVMQRLQKSEVKSKYYVPKKNSNQEPVITSTWMLAFVNETMENVARFRELEASMFQELEYSCEIDQKQYFFQFKPKIDKADHAAARHSWKDLATIVVGIFGVKNAVSLDSDSWGDIFRYAVMARNRPKELPDLLKLYAKYEILIRNWNQSDNKINDSTNSCKWHSYSSEGSQFGWT